MVCFFDLDKMMHWVYLIHFNSRSMQQNTQMYFYNICIWWNALLKCWISFLFFFFFLWKGQWLFWGQNRKKNSQFWKITFQNCILIIDLYNEIPNSFCVCREAVVMSRKSETCFRILNFSYQVQSLQKQLQTRHFLRVPPHNLMTKCMIP